MASEAWTDLGGQEPSKPLTAAQEEALAAQGLGRRDLQIRVGLRRRVRDQDEKTRLRISARQRAIDTAGLAAARNALTAVIDSGITPEELAYRKAVRIARGYERPQPEPRDVSPMTPQESATIGFEQGANVRIPNGLPVNPNQPTLFDTPKSFGPPIEFIKLPEGPSVDLEDRARALEPFMKSDGVLSAYNRVGHAEESYAKNPADSVKMDRVHHALRAKADNLMEEAQPQVDVLTAEEYYTRWGHSPKEIDAQRNDMIKDLREYGANTNSAERQVLLDKVKATAAMAASIKSRR